MLKLLLSIVYLFAITALITISVNLTPAQNIKSESLGEKRVIQGPIAKKIDDYLNRSVPFGFSGAILVAQNDKPILVNGYGLANRERQIPVTTDTVFYIGSITKQFTAAAILKLEMQGKLRVTDTLDKILKMFPTVKRESPFTNYLPKVRVWETRKINTAVLCKKTNSCTGSWK